MNHLRKMV